MSKKVIFVCVGNSCRSQMAEDFFNHHARERGLTIRAVSAGTQPAGYVHPNAIAVMAEKGIDISGHRPKGITPQQLSSHGYVVTMGCSDKDIYPAGFRGDARDWGIEDPFDQPLEIYRRVRDEIEQRVLALLTKFSS